MQSHTPATTKPIQPQDRIYIPPAATVFRYHHPNSSYAPNSTYGALSTYIETTNLTSIWDIDGFPVQGELLSDAWHTWRVQPGTEDLYIYHLGYDVAGRWRLVPLPAHPFATANAGGEHIDPGHGAIRGGISSMPPARSGESAAQIAGSWIAQAGNHQHGDPHPFQESYHYPKMTNDSYVGEPSYNQGQNPAARNQPINVYTGIQAGQLSQNPVSHPERYSNRHKQYRIPQYQAQHQHTYGASHLGALQATEQQPRIFQSGYWNSIDLQQIPGAHPQAHMPTDPSTTVRQGLGILATQGLSLQTPGTTPETPQMTFQDRAAYQGHLQEAHHTGSIPELRSSSSTPSNLRYQSSALTPIDAEPVNLNAISSTTHPNTGVEALAQYARDELERLRNIEAVAARDANVDLPAVPASVAGAQTAGGFNGAQMDERKCVCDLCPLYEILLRRLGYNVEDVPKIVLERGSRVLPDAHIDLNKYTHRVPPSPPLSPRSRPIGVSVGAERAAKKAEGTTRGVDGGMKDEEAKENEKAPIRSVRYHYDKFPLPTYTTTFFPEREILYPLKDVVDAIERSERRDSQRTLTAAQETDTEDQVNVKVRIDFPQNGPIQVEDDFEAKMDDAEDGCCSCSCGSGCCDGSYSDQEGAEGEEDIPFQDDDCNNACCRPELYHQTSLESGNVTSPPEGMESHYHEQFEESLETTHENPQYDPETDSITTITTTTRTVKTVTTTRPSTDGVQDSRNEIPVAEDNAEENANFPKAPDSSSGSLDRTYTESSDASREVNEGYKSTEDDFCQHACCAPGLYDPNIPLHLQDPDDCGNKCCNPGPYTLRQPTPSPEGSVMTTTIGAMEAQYGPGGELTRADLESSHANVHANTSSSMLATAGTEAVPGTAEDGSTSGPSTGVVTDPGADSQVMISDTVVEATSPILEATVSSEALEEEIALAMNDLVVEDREFDGLVIDGCREV